MKPGDLTTIEAVKTWLSIETTTPALDTLLSRMISAASETVLQYMNRTTLALREVTETYDTWDGAPQIVLKSWPVHSIASVVYQNRPIEPSNTPGSMGYRLQDIENAQGGQQLLSFIGYRLCRERQSMTVTYSAGYVRDETRELPEAAEGAATVAITTYNAMIQDLGVLYDGDPLVKVTTGTPTAGQYRVSQNGTYTFPASMAGDEVVIRYSYVPSAIEDTVIQLIGKRFAGKSSQGYLSKTLGGQETVTFDKSDLSPQLRDNLMTFKRVA